jgi:uncharacterized protein
LRFWDASAVVPALLREPKTQTILSLLREDEGMAVWWTTQIECASALGRRLADGTFDLWLFDQSVDRLAILLDRWTEEQPSREMRMLAEHFLVSHRLKTADALQLAAAFQWCGWDPVGREFVCLDNRLRTAALEGFSVLPLVN